MIILELFALDALFSSVSYNDPGVSPVTLPKTSATSPPTILAFLFEMALPFWTVFSHFYRVLNMIIIHMFFCDVYGGHLANPGILGGSSQDFHTWLRWAPRL